MAGGALPSLAERFRPVPRLRARPRTVFFSAAETMPSPRS